jgi:glycosyltransferase involved in cell wall biosynthesis
VHRYDAGEGTGGYVAQLLSRLARIHRMTLYTARVVAPVPENVTVVRVPALMWRAYTAILSFPLGVKAVRRPHDLFHANGWVTGSADVVTAHIVMAAWREAARAARVATPLGERTLGGFVEAREAALFRAARQVIAPSAKVADELARYYGRRDGVTVVPHGFPEAAGAGVAAEAGARPPVHAPAASPAPAARQVLGLPTDATIALFVGDLRKGFDTALAAVRQTPGVWLAVVSHSAVGPMRERARRAGVLDRVQWIGELPSADIAYEAADVLLHPTIYDSFGLVVAEAMAHGVPPVVTRAAGVAELIRHGESGWIVEGDPQAGTAAALAALAGDPALRARLAVGARAVAAQRTWDDVARETLVVYEDARR